MDIVVTQLFLKLVLVSGLALWATIGIINHLQAFAAGVAAVGRIMTMQSFEQEPRIDTPLLARRVTSVAWHRLGFTLVTCMQVLIAVLLGSAAIGFIEALVGNGIADAAIARANLGLAVLLALCFFLTLGGQWFAYYIRQEGLNTLHFALIGLTVATAVLINLR